MTMTAIDSHAHLDDERLRDDLDAICQRAHDAGLEAIITVGTDLASSAAAVEISERFDFVHATVGIHPHDAEGATAMWRAELARLVSSRRVVAIGEIGLDFHYMNSPAKRQEELFAAQLELSGDLSLPVIVHSREADERMMELIEAESFRRLAVVPGVMHCFSGSRATMQRALDLGMHISFAGSVTFKNAGELREIACAVPLGRLLVETDCPYLSPEPNRGKTNEPARVVDVIKCIADERGMDPADLGSTTAGNTRALFGLR